MAQKKRAKAEEPPAATSRRRTQATAHTAPDASQNALERVLDGLSLRDFESGGIRVTHSVPGRPGPHVGALDVIKATTQASRENAVQQWSKMKSKHRETVSGTYSFRFPGQRGPPTEVVDLPTALQIIMLLPGKAAAAIRLKASVLFIRFLGGDLSLIADVYDMNALQEHLAEHWPEHPLATFATPTAEQRNGGLEVQITRACQTFLEGAVPRLVDALAAKFQDVLEAQAKAQHEALAQMQTTARQLASARPVVNINQSPRGGLDALEHANLDAPEDAEAAARIRRSAAPLNHFLRDRWQAEWKRAGLRHTAVSLQFAVLMQESAWDVRMHDPNKCRVFISSRPRK